MPRPTIAIDVRGAQSILDELSPAQFHNELSLCTYVAEKYNATIGTPIINHQLIKLRINSGVLKLHFDMPKGKRGRQPGIQLTDDHKKKLLDGRRTKKNKVATNLNSEWVAKMTEEFGHKPNLLRDILAGKPRAVQKAKCMMCMGGLRNRSPEDPPIAASIRDCRGISCPSYINRPFQKNNAEENTNG